MIRRFWLTNENGEEWDLSARTVSMLANPKGTAEGLGSRSYWQGKRAFAQTDYRDSQSSITGTIHFTNSVHLTSFEQYIHRSEKLYLHVVRNGVAERYCEVECVLSDRTEDLGDWVQCPVIFKRMNPWRNPPKAETKTLSSAAGVTFPKPGDGSLPSSFVLALTPSSSYTGTISVSDGTSTFALKSITVAASDTLTITSIEGEQSVYNDSTDIYDKIDFSNSCFFEAKPGANINITFGASFTGSAKLEIIDQWNEA